MERTGLARVRVTENVLLVQKYKNINALIKRLYSKAIEKLAASARDCFLIQKLILIQTRNVKK